MGERIRVQVEQLEEAKDMALPRYMSQQAAGMDLYANVKAEETLKKGQIKLISTGIKIALPEGYEAQIRPRSGLALKHGISLVNTPGTIDADYRGEIKVIMINFGDEDFVIKRGERIAQMVINKIEQIKWEICEHLESTQRGVGGFGHTGQ
ncbi:dUTP pyrophosphatase [Natranaerovirga hydrolytica]|uniref:Deoxyuridine 5'-triphosphate nucleotidohydrolase n=1 Tax=Natranaerovirga hydrolytica TaxID=680378 RepID=A0A4R1MXG1_9FIRM|nr:dUTP diphosphatase [Natranaerovirga hydrolytica]TCK97947.1 dUTP pyrophosphatase [Natranaerovirga hydrolytica]